MNSGFYNIDDILSDNIMLGARWRTDAVSLGYLDRESEAEDLKKGAQTVLPYWLVCELFGRGLVACDRPSFYKAKFFTTMSAEPIAVNLRDRTDWYYYNGTKIAVMGKAIDIIPQLTNSFGTRLLSIVDKAHADRAVDFEGFDEKL